MSDKPIKRIKKPKVLSSVAKGKINEKRTERYYKNQGYIVDTVRGTKFMAVDYFGLFDHLVTSKEKFILVQTKTNRLPSKEYIQKIKDFPVPSNIVKEIIVWKDEIDIPDIYHY